MRNQISLMLTEIKYYYAKKRITKQWMNLFINITMRVCLLTDERRLSLQHNIKRKQKHWNF